MVKQTSTDETTTNYLHHDHLGSIQAYSDEKGKLSQELSYDAWGCRRNPSTWLPYATIQNADALYDRGFGGHEHIDQFEMINMNGRMYDPVAGMFLSPDPFVQAPDNPQGFYRYSYCMNNPLSLTDPSGYSWFSKNWKSLTAAVVGIGVTVLTAGTGASFGVAVAAGAAGGAASALTVSLLNGSNFGQIAKNTMVGIAFGVYILSVIVTGDESLMDYFFMMMLILLFISVLSLAVARNGEYLVNANRTLQRDEEELLQVLKINKKQIKAYVALAKERHDVKLTAHLLDLLGEASQKNVIDNVMQYLQTRELSKQNIERVFPELSASEQEICYLILQNRKLSEICTLLNKSESNITTQRANIRKKLGMGSADNLKKVLEKRIAESQ